MAAMLKILLSVLGLFFTLQFLLPAHAANYPGKSMIVPNQGFENWSVGLNNNAWSLDDWTLVDTQTGVIKRSSLSQSGNFSALLKPKTGSVTLKSNVFTLKPDPKLNTMFVLALKSKSLDISPTNGGATKGIFGITTNTGSIVCSQEIATQISWKEFSQDCNLGTTERKISIFTTSNIGGQFFDNIRLIQQNADINPI